MFNVSQGSVGLEVTPSNAVYIPTSTFQELYISTTFSLLINSYFSGAEGMANGRGIACSA